VNTRRHLSKEQLKELFIKKETPKKITKEYLNQLNMELTDWLMITDIDLLREKREAFKDKFTLLTQKQINKLEVMPILTEHYLKLYFKAYPTLESYIKVDKDKIYEDSMGRKNHPERWFSERCYNIQRNLAIKYGVLQNENTD
jgi:hypothetical protein